MRVFVTGGTGFIGRHLVARLRAAHHDVVCLVRTGSDTSVLPDDAELARGDVTDRMSLASGMRGCDRVASLANLYEFWVTDRDAYRRVNVTGTRNVMETALDEGVSKIVHVSTAAVYGNAAWPVTEDTPEGDRCFGEYSRSKRRGDRVIWDLFESRDLPVVMVYPGAVIGPGDPKAARRYLRNVLEGRLPAQVLTGSPFPFVSVDDVAAGILAAMEGEGNTGERYILAAENLTFGEVNRMIAEVSGVDLPGFVMPDWMTVATAHLCTLLARATRRPPMLDLAIDQVRLMRQGMRTDGSKAERELGLRYEPVRQVIERIVGGSAGAGRI